MVLRVKVEIVPFGVEEKAREIYRFDIFNKRQIDSDWWAYGVIELGRERNTGGLYVDDICHLRAAGALALVRSVLDKRELLHRVDEVYARHPYNASLIRPAPA